MTGTKSLLLTVEKLLPAGSQRKCAPFGAIGERAALGLLAAPRAAHPFSLTNLAIDAYEAYKEATPFLEQLHETWTERKSPDRPVRNRTMNGKRRGQLLNLGDAGSTVNT